MPEGIDSQQTENIAKITSEARAPLSDLEVREIVLKSNEDFVGSGAECIVVGKRGNPELVVAFDYDGIEKIEEAKRLFYWHRIYSTLFPHNFPRFYTSWAGEKSSGTIRQRIQSPESGSVIKYPFSIVKEMCQYYHLPLWVDRFFENFIIGLDGGEYFVDKVTTISSKNAWNLDNVRKFMRENNTTKSDTRLVEGCIRRLNQLASVQ